MEDLSGWSLRAKIGQLLMCGFDGLSPTEEIKTLLRDYQVGGVIYFRRNVGTSSQIKALSDELRRIGEAAGRVPLAIAVDQEGGMVARIDRDVALMPGNMAIGATRSAEYAYECARISGAELAAMGINVNFAPCLDVNNNPANPVIGVRSYGEDPQLVAQLGAAAVGGYQAAGVSACAKHFPGHGDTAADSHHELPVVAHSTERMNALELVPFRAAIAAGVDAIMTAHVLFPAYEPSLQPATLSRHVLTGLLREQLGYEGVIVTDCLEMKAISETVGIGRGAVMAVQAGADLVLVSHRFDRQLEALEALYAAVVSGDIPEARIDESVRRILKMKKARTARNEHAPVEIGHDDHRAFAREVCARAVTLVKVSDQALPLRRDQSVLAVWPEVCQSSEVDEVIAQEQTIGSLLRSKLYSVTEIRIGTEPSEEEIARIMAVAGSCGQIVVGTYNAAFSERQTGIVQALVALGHGAAGEERKTVIAVALRNPYDVHGFPGVDAYLACYENRPAMLEALAGVLAGEIEARGQLPVRLLPAIYS